MKRLHVETKEIPEAGVFKGVKKYLIENQIRELQVLFHEKVTGLGCAYHDHRSVTVVAFNEKGRTEEFSSAYGSSASMFSNDVSAAAAAGKVWPAPQGRGRPGSRS